MIFRQNTETGIWYGRHKDANISVSWAGGGNMLVDEGCGAVPGANDPIVNVPEADAPVAVRKRMLPVEDLSGVAEAYNAS